MSERLENLKLQNKTSEGTQAKLDEIMDMIEHEKFELETFDNVLIRKLIECIKVLSKTEILVIFKGGYEVRTEIELRLAEKSAGCFCWEAVIWQAILMG